MLSRYVCSDVRGNAETSNAVKQTKTKTKPETKPVKAFVIFRIYTL